MRGGVQHAVEIENLCVGPRRLPGAGDAHANPRIPPRQLVHHGECRVLGLAHAKDDLVGRVILPEEAFQVLAQPRLHTMQRLQQGDSRQRFRHRAQGGASTTLEPMRRHDDERQVNG